VSFLTRVRRSITQIGERRFRGAEPRSGWAGTRAAFFHWRRHRAQCGAPGEPLVDGRVRRRLRGLEEFWASV